MAITTRAGKGSALTHAEMDANLGYLVPSGAVLPFAMNTAPTGWLACSGQAISRTSYADLFAAIGTTFGAGNGSTTFNLPDLRGEFIRGWDNGRGVDSGRTFGSAQTDMVGPHSHTLNNATAVRRNVAGYNTASGGAGYAEAYDITVNNNSGTETRPRNIAMLYCIKI